jgi:glycosyltransferase involved in cell wall biosynthesis
MSKIRILAIPPDTHGVGKFRITGPYTFLQENYGDDFHIDLLTNIEDKDDIFNNYDIIVMHTFIHNKASSSKNINRVKWLKEKGKIVIIDFDDYWEPDIRHPMYLQAKISGAIITKINLLKEASYITVTTPVYQDTIIKKFNLKNVVVFPNAIDETEPQFIPSPIPSEKIRFGWLGGSSHLSDIDLMTLGISKMYNTFIDKIQFVLCGFDLRGTVTEINKTTQERKTRNVRPEETVWYKYEHIFTNNYRVLDNDYINFLKLYKELEYDDTNKPYIRRWTKEINKYAVNYNYFDVSLAPLVPTIFNINKSQLKAIESGFFKKALIASDVSPYTIDLISAIEFNGKYNPKGNALLVDPNKNHKQWFQHMKRLVENPNMIEDLGNKLYETVKDKYSLKKVCQDRSEFLKSIIK